ncbi:hypothetical protein BDF20DRAFT_854424 [Mycotypha africana]|uniref:uncharacterized protein n=1 Tax=Mycotypha africana TaxID=64632 RepID=UPI0023014EDE|nr:uncharacterized protein BDF20DRAFT_854424 [Mycotypha africana]KAI8988203.1 hypothetical protein BDF20DRAFT_854424 [Mycotypha africana]
MPQPFTSEPMAQTSVQQTTTELQTAQQPLSQTTATAMSKAEVPVTTVAAATAAASSFIPANAVTTAQAMLFNPSTSVITAPPPQPATTFEEIQKQLKATLDHIEQRNMVSGFQTLSKATGAVVDSCEHLGLTSDDHPYNAIDREQFWAGLNNCWLYALAQRQEPSCDAERLTDQHLYNLREMVVAWADKLERYGLVDYEMGWWEADILSAIDGILAMNYAAAQAAAQAVVAQAAAALFGDDVNM